MNKIDDRTGAAVRVGVLALALIAPVALSACNYLGPAIYFAKGPDDIKAVYALPKDRTTVIFVDDRNGLVPKREQRIKIGQVAEDELLNKAEIKDMISTRNAVQAAAGERFGKPKTIAEIGKAVGAQVIIYASVEQFTLSEDGVSYAPSATLRVKVVEVETGQRLFPAPDAPREWHPLVVKIPAPADAPPTGVNEQLEALGHVARWTGSALARLFYDHQPGTDPTRMEQSEKR